MTRTREGDERAILEVLECAASGRLASLPDPVDRAGERIESDDREWIVTVGPFQWHGVSLADQPALVALRDVQTPAARLTQGFVIRRDEMHRLLQDSRYEASLRDGKPTEVTEARIPIDGDPWTVTLDASAAVTEAGARAREVRTMNGF